MASARVAACNTLLVGDDVCDIDAALAAGVEPVLVLTGKGSAAAQDPAYGHVRVHPDLRAFAQSLVGTIRTGRSAS